LATSWDFVAIEMKSPSPSATDRYSDEARIMSQKLPFMTIPKSSCPMRSATRTSVMAMRK